MNLPNFYMQNMQSLLKMAVELHNRGFGRLSVEPSISPSGLHWRCVYKNPGEQDVVVSSWFQSHYEIKEKLIAPTIQELTDFFVKEHCAFLETCRGDNNQYTNWFADMTNSLGAEELPYAYADYFSATDYWLTNTERKIYLPA